MYVRMYIWGCIDACKYLRYANNIVLLRYIVVTQIHIQLKIDRYIFACVTVNLLL